MTTYAVIGYNNLIGSATLSGGDWATGGAASTLDNLKTRYLRQYAVSDGASNAATQFTIDLGATQTIGVIALCNHNLTAATGQVTITGAADSGFTQIAWRGNNMQVYAGQDFAVALPDAVGAQYWKVEILDASNAAGYVKLGRVFIGPAFAPLQGIEFNSSLAVESRAGINDAWSGMEHFELRRNRRVWRGQFSHLNESEACTWIGIQQSNDTSGEVYLVDTAARQSGNIILTPDTLNTWTQIRATATANTAANPLDGAITADTLTETSDTGAHHAQLQRFWSLASAIASQQQFTLSCYVSAVSASRYPVLYLCDNNTGQTNTIRAHFDVVNKTVLSYPSGTAQNISAFCQDAGNGWSRLVMSGKLNWSAAAKADFSLFFDNAYDLALTGYAGDTGKSMTVWGAMLNYGGLLDYINDAHPMILDTSGTRGTRSFLGRLRSLNPVEWPYINQFATAMEISEVL